MKRAIPLVAISAVLAVLPASAIAGKSKQVIFDKTNGECTKGMTTGTPTSSSATIAIKKGVVSVKISLKGLEPNTTYEVDVVQVPSGESCVQVPGESSLKTNSKGKGKVSYSEPVLAGQTGVFVMLIQTATGDILATPTVPLA